MLAGRRGRRHGDLDRYGESSSTDERRTRVQLAALAPVNGSREARQEYIKLPRQDYLDVIASVEYPRESEAPHVARPDLSPQQGRKLELISWKEREQYLT